MSAWRHARQSGASNLQVQICMYLASCIFLGLLPMDNEMPSTEYRQRPCKLYSTDTNLLKQPGKILS